MAGQKPEAERSDHRRFIGKLRHNPMKRVYLHLVMTACLLALPLTAAAQVHATTETMKRMLADAGKKGLKIEQAGVRELGALCPGRQMRVRMADSTLLDMGVALFHDTLERIYSPPVYDFIERYLLALLLKPGAAEQRWMMREDFVRLKVNGRDLPAAGLSIAQAVGAIRDTSFFWLRGDSSSFRAQWFVNAKGVANIEISFPKQYDLILGSDKKELAGGFRTGLEAFAYRKAPVTNFHVTDFQRTFFPYLPGQDVYANASDTFIIPQMKNGLFLQKRGDAFEYLFNERMGMESLQNLFSHADKMERDVGLLLTVKGYQLADSFSFGLDRLCAWMKRQRCIPYMGVETQTGDGYTGTVMYVNRDLMYMHLLYYVFPTAAFKHDAVPVRAALYPYIPINNIATLYDDVEQYKERLK
jgi:hypothetical protein